MAYQKSIQSEIFKQELGYDYLEIEFILQDVDVEKREKSPIVDEKSDHEKYVFLPLVSKKEMRKDRKMRQKSYIKFNPPVSNFSVAERRIFY